jgi:predicted ferric reductase
MTFRGLSPATSLTRWGLAGIAIGIALGATGPAALRSLQEAVAAGASSLPWQWSRLLAFGAYVALTASVVYGLLLSTKVLDAIAHRPITFALHQDLAAFGLGLAGVHGALLGLDRSVPMSIAQLAIPFAAPYRPVWVGLGQLAFWIAVVVVASFYVRRRIGQRAWRLLHYATFLAFAGATAHGLGSGSDTATFGRWLYLVATAVVAFLFVYRIASAVLGRSAVRRLAREPA